MFRNIRSIAAGLIVAAGLATLAPLQAEAKNMAQAHMGHVMESWQDTPGQAGLLPMAEMEAQTAQRHAGLAAKTPDDLKAMKMHTRHVLHALDPSVESTGPGRGYGVQKAASGAAFHIRAAAKAEQASDNVTLHAEHVATAAANAAERAEDAVALAQEILAAETADAAAPKLQSLQTLLDQIVAGEDLNDDGKIGWKEGGLSHARQHMAFMYKGEGMEMPE